MTDIIWSLIKLYFSLSLSLSLSWYEQKILGIAKSDLSLNESHSNEFSCMEFGELRPLKYSELLSCLSQMHGKSHFQANSKMHAPNTHFRAYSKNACLRCSHLLREFHNSQSVEVPSINFTITICQRFRRIIRSVDGFGVSGWRRLFSSDWLRPSI